MFRSVLLHELLATTMVAGFLLLLLLRHRRVFLFLPSLVVSFMGEFKLLGMFGEAFGHQRGKSLQFTFYFLGLVNISCWGRGRGWQSGGCWFTRRRMANPSVHSVPLNRIEPSGLACTRIPVSIRRSVASVGVSNSGPFFARRRLVGPSQGSSTANGSAEI